MWFKLYCGAMTLLYALLMVLGGILTVLGPSMAEEEEAAVLAIEGIVFAVMGLPLAALFGVGLFLPQRKWAWIYGIVLIALGMTSACCLPATIPLLIFWIKQEMRVYFNCAA
jgi:O-antigen ligase